MRATKKSSKEIFIKDFDQKALEGAACIKFLSNKIGLKGIDASHCLLENGNRYFKLDANDKSNLLIRFEAFPNYCKSARDSRFDHLNIITGTCLFGETSSMIFPKNKKFSNLRISPVNFLRDINNDYSEYPELEIESGLSSQEYQQLSSIYAILRNLGNEIERISFHVQIPSIEYFFRLFSIAQQVGYYDFEKLKAYLLAIQTRSLKMRNLFFHLIKDTSPLATIHFNEPLIAIEKYFEETISRNIAPTINEALKTFCDFNKNQIPNMNSLRLIKDFPKSLSNKGFFPNWQEFSHLGYIIAYHQSAFNQGEDVLNLAIESNREYKYPRKYNAFCNSLDIKIKPSIFFVFYNEKQYEILKGKDFQEFNEKFSINH